MNEEKQKIYDILKIIVTGTIVGKIEWQDYYASINKFLYTLYFSEDIIVFYRENLFIFKKNLIDLYEISNQLHYYYDIQNENENKILFNLIIIKKSDSDFSNLLDELYWNLENKNIEIHFNKFKEELNNLQLLLNIEKDFIISSIIENSEII